MATNWFYISNGSTRGPVAAAELKALAGAGKLLPTDPVWTNGMATWLPASTVQGLFSPPAPVAKGPPPLPVAKKGPPPLPALKAQDGPTRAEEEARWERGARWERRFWRGLWMLIAFGLLGLGRLLNEPEQRPSAAQSI